jgi:RNA recognition motif-containing protein
MSLETEEEDIMDMF